MHIFIYYIYFLLLCFFPIDIETIVCVVSKLARFDLKTIDSANIQANVRSLNTNDYDDRTICKIVFYKQPGHLDIWFGDEAKFRDKLQDGEIYLYTEWDIDDFPFITDTLKYVCSKQDECDRHFVIDHVKWFVEANHIQLQKAIEPLMNLEMIPPGQCFINNKKTSKCGNHLCSSIYWTNATKYQPGCANAIGVYDKVRIEINTYIIPIVIEDIDEENTYKEIQMILYQCKYNECNSRNITNQIRMIVNQLYDLSTIRSILNYIIKEPVIETTITSITIPFETSYKSSQLSTTSKIDDITEKTIQSSTRFLTSFKTNILSKSTKSNLFSSTSVQGKTTKLERFTSNIISTKSVNTNTHLSESTLSSSKNTMNVTLKSFISTEITSELLTTMTTKSNSGSKCFHMIMILILSILLSHWIL